MTIPVAIEKTGMAKTYAVARYESTKRTEAIPIDTARKMTTRMRRGSS